MSCLVIHPEGDKTCLKVVRVSATLVDALKELVPATRCVFGDDEDAVSYAVDFAAQNRMRYLGIETAPRALRA